MDPNNAGGTPGAQDAFSKGENEPSLQDAMANLTGGQNGGQAASGGSAASEPTPTDGQTPAPAQNEPASQPQPTQAQPTPDGGGAAPTEQTFEYLGKKLTWEQAQERIKAAEEYQANGTRRNQQAVEKERAFEAKQRRLDELETKELQRELDAIELPKRPVHPLEPREIDFKNLETGELNEAGFLAALQQYRKDEQAAREADATFDERYRTAEQQRRDKQAEIDGRKQQATQQTEAITQAEQEDLQNVISRHFVDNELTQEEVNRAWERTHEIIATRPKGTTNVADIFERTLYREVYPGRTIAVQAETKKADADLKTQATSQAADPAVGVRQEAAAPAGNPTRLSDLPPNSDEAYRYIDEGIRRDGKSGSNDTLMEVLHQSGILIEDIGK